MAKEATTEEVGAREAGRATPEPGVAHRAWGWIIDRREASVFLIAILLILYFQSSNSAFLSAGNIRNLAQSTAAPAIVAIGLVFILLLGEIDISVGAVFGFAPIVVYLADQQFALALALLIALLACAAVGLLNGVLTIYFRIPSFVGTLGVFFLISGLNVILTDGFPKSTPEDQFATQILGGRTLSGIAWALVLVIIMQIMLTRSRWGLHTFATGGNLLGSSEAGVRVNRVKIVNFMVCSAFAGFAGILEAIRIASVDPLAGGGETTFFAVSAAVVGGTSLFGGVGTVVGALLGTLVLTVLRIGFTLQGVDASYFNVINGVAVILAMALNVYVARRRRSGRV